ncbi:phage lysis regulatory protein, LysB family [Halopseudomonas litoralis]|uniref:Phage lysis regulatory protein, LysB family n=1 Tax=Halopseudomonas litoralis TaxID=797277 RepID=A0A1H1SQ28_9GAMM|nr:phage lysis regulatory protein, LysB family [Halopseudomonas litoralis]
MSALRQALYGAGLIAALCLLIWSQQSRIERAIEERATAQGQSLQAKRETARHQQLIDQLEQELAVERAAQLALRNQQAGIRQQLQQRQQRIRELTHENQLLRDWSATDLPGTAQRLRTRPAITGAADYQAWLSRSDALHSARDQPGAERRPAD